MTGKVEELQVMKEAKEVKSGTQRLTGQNGATFDKIKTICLYEPRKTYQNEKQN